MYLSRAVFRLILCLWPLAVLAEPFSGNLIAERDCPLAVSTKRQEHPGKERLVPGQTYQVVGRNQADPSHYLLRIESTETKERWVEIACGRLAEAAPATPQEEPVVPPQAEVPQGPVAPQAADTPKAAIEPLAPTPAPAKKGSMDGQFVLSASWQPAFCESHRGRPECRRQTSERTDARQFSLHGLWPQPIGRTYCGVKRQDRQAAESGNWKRLPTPDLTPDTRAALEQRMPGASSGLERHEWTKHGSCYGTDAETYFTQAVALIDQLNASEVRQVFESNIGKRLRAQDVRSAFDRAFGPGAGERVRLECDRAGQITELRIGLKGVITDQSALGDLIGAAPTRTVGCRGGWVDRAGPGR